MESPQRFKTRTDFCAALNTYNFYVQNQWVKLGGVEMLTRILWSWAAVKAAYNCVAICASLMTLATHVMAQTPLIKPVSAGSSNVYLGNRMQHHSVWDSSVLWGGHNTYVAASVYDTISKTPLSSHDPQIERMFLFSTVASRDIETGR